MADKVEVEARTIVEGARQDHYDSAHINLNRIAGAWSSYLGITVDAYDVVNLMVMLKVLRSKGKGYQHDSVVDGIGYFILQEKLKESEK